MEVKKAKGGTYPLALFVMLMLLLNAYCSDAAVLVKSNTTVRCDGRLDECLIEDDLELEFLINPYISRVLAGTGKSVVEIDAKKDSGKTCGTGCTDDAGHPCRPCSDANCQKKSPYRRGCTP
ncbi:hypothetical protein FCV25MIE_08111 [Fagus crenata]